MKLSRSMLALLITMGVAAVSGFSSGGLSPEPLKAQSACGRFNGSSCQDDCLRECTNGSCCSWAHYYYSTPLNPF